MKKCIFLLAAMLGFVAFSQAQDAKAKAILDNLAAKNKSYSSLTADFTILLDNRKDKVKDTQQAKLQLKGNMFKIRMKESDIYSNGKVKWTYLKESNEVNIQNINPNDPNIMNNPSKLFNAYLTDFKYIYKGTRREDGIQVDEINLYPKDLKAAYSLVKLYVDAASGNISKVIYQGRDGISYTIRFTKLTPNLPIAGSEFTFNEAAHPDVEVVDMR